MKKTHLFGFVLIAAFTINAMTSYGQGMAVNATGAAANASAILDVNSTTQGMLIPRMTTGQRTSISSPATGLLVYQTDGTPGFYYYNGSAWVSLNTPGGTAGGDLTGNYPNPTISPTASSDIVTAINTGTSTINAVNLEANVTTQGNTFNGTSQLVQTNGSGQLPALSGANLTNLPAANVTGTLSSGVLPTSGVSAGTYGSSTSIPVVTVDNKGRVTSIGTSTVSAGDGGATTTLDLYVDLTTTETIPVDGSTYTPVQVTLNNEITTPTIGSWSSNTYTCGATGIYFIDFQLTQTNINSSFTLFPEIQISGEVPVYPGGTSPSNTFTAGYDEFRTHITSMLPLTSGQTVTMWVFNSSSSLTQTLSTTGSTRLYIYKMP